MKTGAAAMLFLAAFFLQGAAGRLFAIGSIEPDFILCFFVVICILSLIPAATAVLAVGTSLLYDICFSPFIGMTAVAVLITGLVLVAVTERINGWSLVWVLLLTAGASALENLLIWIGAGIMGSPYGFFYWLKWMLFSALYNCAVSAILYLIFNRVKGDVY